MPWDGAFHWCEIWVQSKIWAVCRGSNHGKPHDDNYQCFDRCSRKCWVLRVLLPKPNGQSLDFEYEQAYQFHYQQNLWRQLLRTVWLSFNIFEGRQQGVFDFNELHTKSVMRESFGCSLFTFQIGQYPVPFCSYPAHEQIQAQLLIVEFWRDGKSWSLFDTSRGSLRKDQDPSKTAVNVPRFPMKLTTVDAQVALAESHVQKAMEAKAASEVSAACLILRFFRDEQWVGAMDKL